MSISLLRKLLMKEAVKDTAGSSGIMSINKGITEKVEKQLQKYVSDAMQQGVDLDTLSPEQLKMIVQMNKPKPPRVIPADSPEGRQITEQLFGKKGEVVDMTGKKIDTRKGIMGGKSVEDLMESSQVTKGARNMKKNKKVQDREMFQAANKRLTSDVDSIIKNIKSMEPITAMKEANSVIGRKGKYKNLTQEQSKKILQDTEDHIFQRDPDNLYDPDPEGFAKGGRIGFKGGADMSTVADSKGNVGAKSVSVSPSGSVTTSRTKGPDSPDDRGNADQNFTQYLVNQGYTPKDINRITKGPNLIQKAFNKYNSLPFYAKAGINTLAPVELVKLFQMGNALNTGYNQITNPYYEEEDLTLGGIGGPKYGVGIDSSILTDSPYENIIPQFMSTGGRANFVGGGMGRREFLKMLAGLGAGIGAAKTGILKLAGKEPAKQVAKEVVQQSTTTPPPYFFKLAEKIKKLGSDTTPTNDRTIAKSLKSKDGTADYILEEDMATGDIQIKKVNMERDDMINDIEIMELRKGEVVKGPDGKPIRTPDEYDEVTESISRIHKDNFNDPDYSEGIRVKEVMEEVMDAPSIKKASGGVARLLGE